MGGEQAKGIKISFSSWMGSGAKGIKILFPYGWAAGRRGAKARFRTSKKTLTKIINGGKTTTWI